MYNFVVDFFLKVNLSQFRKDYLALIKKEKAKALRKKVSEKSKKQCKTLNINFCKEDKSSNKNVSLIVDQVLLMVSQNERLV